MDRERVVNEPGRNEWEPEEPHRDYEPIHPRGTDWRGRLSKIFGPLVAIVLALAKFSFVLVKFGSIFIAVAAYALIWGWKFAVGVVVLILLHETGHYIEAKREGLNPRLPVFVPFLGAYVAYTRGHPWQTVRVAIAGPILGGAAAFVLYLVGKGQPDPQNIWLALAYFGFFLNLFNMLPFGFFDGGAVWRSARFLRLGGGGNLAIASYALYFATAAMLVLGMVASHVPQDRL
jgi:Zn-dependent protease